MTPTALITGASRGLGLALARELAQQGWTLIINARGADALETARAELAQQTQVIAIAGDVTDAAHRQALAEAVRSVGGLDVLVNNASILGPSPQPNLLDYPLEMLEQVYRANVIAPLALIQTVAADLRPGARILNITSDAGVEAYPGWGGYGSSKAALEHWSRILAEEKPDLRVYIVDPGDMRTQMHQEAFPGEDISDRPLPEVSVPGLIDLIMGEHPSGRYKAREVNQKPKAAYQPWLNITLTVPDVNEALTVYRDVFGMTVTEEWTEVGHGVLLDAGRATIELLNEPHAAEVDRVEVGRRVAGQVRLAIAVADVEAKGAEIQNAGAEALAGIVDTPWGHRNQRVKTADGMQITLFEVRS